MGSERKHFAGADGGSLAAAHCDSGFAFEYPQLRGLGVEAIEPGLPYRPWRRRDGGLLGDVVDLDDSGAGKQFHTGIDQAVADHLKRAVLGEAEDDAGRQQDLGTAFGGAEVF